MTRAVIYARLSLSKEESVSIARQLDSCRKYAEGRGWDVIGEFVDDGVSATANRPQDRKGWRQLLQAGDFEAVVVWKVDRLARKVLDFLHVDETLRKRGAGLVAVEDPIDMTTPMGRAFATILAVFGEMEAAAIAARVSAARAHLVREGRFAGGAVPYGLATGPHPGGVGKTLIRDDERFPWLTELTRRALAGETVNSLAKWMTDSGAPPPTRWKGEGRYSWNRQTIDGILRNPSLAGMTPRNPGSGRSRKPGTGDVLRDDNGQPIIKPELAVISADEFATLQHMLASRSTPQAKPMHERQRTSPILSKLAHCFDCGVYMCRGVNQKRAVIQCPQCRQTMNATHLTDHLTERLLNERAEEQHRGRPIAEAWEFAGEAERRDILAGQLASLKIRRGVPGRRFDASRVLLWWNVSTGRAAA